MLVLFNVFVASDAVRGEGLLWLLLVFFRVVVIAVLHTAAAADSDDNDNDDRANCPSYSVLLFYIIIIIITYIYNALNDALSASRIHNKLKTILSKYIHIYTQ